MSQRTTVEPAIAAGFAALIAGLIAWLWLGDWRYALAGLGALFGVPIVFAVAEVIELEDP